MGQQRRGMLAIIGLCAGMLGIAGTAVADEATVFLQPASIGRGLKSSVKESADNAMLRAAKNFKLSGSTVDADYIFKPSVARGRSGFILRVEVTAKNQSPVAKEISFSDIHQIDAKMGQLLVTLMTIAESKSAAGAELPTRVNEPMAVNHPPALVGDQGERTIASEVVALPASTPSASNRAPAADPVQSALKHWYLGFGPAWSSALVGNAGTKYNVHIAHLFPFSEHLDAVAFYDANMNSDQQAKTDILVLGGGLAYYMADRISDTAPFVRGDLGYAGPNRNQDGGYAYALSAGLEFSRDKSVSFQVSFRFQVVMTSTVSNGVSTNPSMTQLRFGILF